ncbi:MAG TPA: AMP-binding protein [Sporichthyaceae bacterium]|jgi:acyl-CoA synthetase (AMP-forming)/AMP-acid ligase II|nr:AMP-binding protein [Sporichthyaceae bacterium]
MRTELLPEHRAEVDPHGRCLSDPRQDLDNAEFGRRVQTAGAALAEAGVGRGDVVALLLPNSAEFVIGLFAAWRLGATVTPVNPALTEPEIVFQLDDAAAKVVIGDPVVHRVVNFDVAALDRAGGPCPHPAPLDPDRLALLIYTSGTTGRPKGVMLDHGNLTAMADGIIDGLMLGGDEHSLLVLPLFHVNGIVVGVLAPLLVGGRVSIAERFRAEDFLATVQRLRPTYFSAVPTIYAMLTALPTDAPHDVSSLRRVICGAAPMPAELIERFENRFAVPLIEGYGLSEGTCASTVNPPDGPRKPGTVGLPLPGQQVALMDAEGRLVTDGTGEVVIRGRNVMRGYLNRPEETAATVVDGWLHTGDVGRFDPDGYLVLVDRIKDMIIRGGENLYPKEIENALYAHPDVAEAAVVGTPDPVFGEIPVAYVALRPGATVTGDALIEHCRGLIARMKVPTRLTVLDSLPKNPVGKIDKPTLRRLS